ncbi:putative alpha-1,3-mannosyltransferase, partial [Aureobasidium melanogenum]
MTPGSPSKYTDYFHQPRRRTHIVRILAISLAIVLCYIVATRGPESSQWVPTTIQDKVSFGDHAGKPVDEKAPPRGYSDTDSGRWTEPAEEQDESTLDSGKEMEHTVDRIEGDEEAEYEKLKDSQTDNKDPDMKEGSDYVSSTGSDEESAVEPSHHTQSTPFVAHNIGNGEKYSFQEALRDVLHMVPDEIYTRDLLRPLEGGGQDRLKELGIRARAFHKFFTVWEALHVVADTKLTYVRDDVINYLENAPEKELAEVSDLERGDIIRAYERYRAFLAKLSSILYPYTSPYFADHLTLHAHFRNGGRGVVLSGNDKQAPFILTSIMSFRKLGCKLRVEIMYLGENDLNDDWRMRLESIPGVVTRDLSQMVSDEGWELKGWASKAFALLMSSFREVIYLDADTLFFVNPAELFEDPGYIETGALFFRDRVYAPSSRKQWLKDILPKPISKKAQTSRYWTGESREQQESGCLVVDKWRHFVAMLTVTRMNGPDRDDNAKTGAKGVYSLFYGDKETFWLGWELAGDTDYWFNEGAAGNMGVVSEHVYYKLVEGKAEIIENYQPPVLQSTHEHDAETQDKSNQGAETDKEASLTKRDDKVHELYTVSSPQLLHLDLNNRPLWFNGWILDDKYEENKHVNVSTWDVYLSEVKETHEAAEWRIGGHNMATLKSNKAFEFTQKEKDVLQMIVETARENGALKPGQ